MVSVCSAHASTSSRARPSRHTLLVPLRREQSWGMMDRVLGRMRSGSGRIIGKRASSSHGTLPGILNVYRSTNWPFQKAIVHEHLLCSNNSAILFHLHLGVSGRRCLQFVQHGGVDKQVDRAVSNGRLAATMPHRTPRYLILAGIKRRALAVGPRCGP